MQYIAIVNEVTRRVYGFEVLRKVNWFGKLELFPRWLRVINRKLCEEIRLKGKGRLGVVQEAAEEEEEDDPLAPRNNE